MSPAEIRVESDVTAAPGLRQTLRISPGVLHPGDTITVTSWVRNLRSRRWFVEHRACSLTFGGTLELEVVGGRYGCYSSERVLAEGDSLYEQEPMAVASSPGTYSLTVQHLLNPAHVVAFEIRIDPR